MKNQHPNHNIDFANVVLKNGFPTFSELFSVSDKPNPTVIIPIFMAKGIFWNKDPEVRKIVIEEQLTDDANYYIIVKENQRKEFDKNPLLFIKNNLQYLVTIEPKDTHSKLYRLLETYGYIGKPIVCVFPEIFDGTAQNGIIDSNCLGDEFYVSPRLPSDEELSNLNSKQVQVIVLESNQEQDIHLIQNNAAKFIFGSGPATTFKVFDDKFNNGIHSIEQISALLGIAFSETYTPISDTSKCIVLTKSRCEHICRKAKTFEEAFLMILMLLDVCKTNTLSTQREYITNNCSQPKDSEQLEVIME